EVSGSSPDVGSTHILEAVNAVQPHVVLPLLTAALAAITAFAVLDQWFRKRRAYQLVWALGLAWYMVAAGAEALGGARGWSEPAYRAWYLFGAFGVASWLGLGTVFLLRKTRFGYLVAAALLLSGTITLAGESRIPLIVAALGAAALAIATWRQRDRVAPVAALLLVGGSLAAAVLVLSAPLAPPGYALNPETQVPVGSAFPEQVRILSPLFNIPGAVALVGGALYSAYIFMPKTRVLRVSSTTPVVGAVGRGLAVVVNFIASIPAAIRAGRRGELHSRVPATLLIALGGIFPSFTSGLTRFEITWGHYLGELIGVALILAGFLISLEVFSDLRVPFTRIVLIRRPSADVVDTPAPPA
ncbi:MAG TPA: hypothetical protein VFP83_08240, partial [Candidatus Limnocylindria bacterium]|nr:hypothetical protein [Candidatus Limnocylindria bacterium]